MTDQLIKLQAPTGIKQRLDKFLAAALPQHSRARLQGLVKAGRVEVNARVTTKTGYPLVGGESVKVTVPPAEPTWLEPEPIPLNVVFENDDVIVIDKPAGLVVHPAAGHARGTLVQAVLAHTPEIEGVGGELRPGLVHRLDKDTSGLILLAKNERAQRTLQAQFQSRAVKKTYIALVDGIPATARGRIEAPLGRHPRERKRMAVVPAVKGRAAVTEYHLMEKFPAHTLLEAYPLTGRTHQIRVHLAFIGCPIVGDRVYGRKHPSLPLARQFLHAARLTLRLPGENQPRSFEARLPQELEGLLANLRSET